MDMVEVEVTGLTLKPYHFESNIAKFDLNLIGAEINGELGFTFEYRTKLFKAETIKRFVNYFEKILEAILENPEIKLSEIEMISEDEKNWILSEMNNTQKKSIQTLKHCINYLKNRDKEPQSKQH